IESGQVRASELDARSLGLGPARFEDLQVADLDEAARAVDEAVRGVPGPRLDVVLLNAAASLVVGGAVEELAEGLDMARRAVASGQASRTLERLREMSQE